MALSSRTIGSRRSIQFEWQMSTIRAFRDLLQSADDQAAHLAAAGLYQEGLKMMAISQRQVPVRWGVLRSTGHVYPPQQHGKAVEVVLAYGGPAAPYAWVQHENLDLRHDDPTKAKYLEDPVLGQRDVFARNLHRRMGFIFAQANAEGAALNWPQEHWQGPPSLRRARKRTSPRRPTA